MENNNFELKINCVVLSTNKELTKRFVLSLDEKEIKFPSFYVNKNMLNNLNQHIIDFLKIYIFVSDFELMPQLINLNSLDIEKNNENCLNLVYGFVVQFTQSIDNCHWVEFNYFDPNKYLNLLAEVTQKL